MNIILLLLQCCRILAFLLASILFIPLTTHAQTTSTFQEKLDKLAWQRGPTTGKISDEATIAVPKNYVFLDSANTSKFLEINGNPPREGHYVLAPENLDWFAVFNFNPSGYVKDDEKINADDLLNSLKKSDGPENDQRKNLGMSPIYTVGWAVAPHYDLDTKRLEWGVKLKSDRNDAFVNYSIRLLGRNGVMDLTLVAGTETLTSDINQLKTALKGFNFVPGKKYSEFKEGDKVAQYGLAALILGGAAAVATKKGLWAVIGGFFAAFWKLIIGGAVALFAGIGSLFRRKK